MVRKWITEQEGDAKEVEVATAASAAAAAAPVGSFRKDGVWYTSPPAPVWNPPPVAPGCTSITLFTWLHFACSSCSINQKKERKKKRKKERERKRRK